MVRHSIILSFNHFIIIFDLDFPLFVKIMDYTMETN
jgi:hypothetical protein